MNCHTHIFPAKGARLRLLFTQCILRLLIFDVFLWEMLWKTLISLVNLWKTLRKTCICLVFLWKTPQLYRKLTIFIFSFTDCRVFHKNTMKMSVFLGVFHKNTMKMNVFLGVFRKNIMKMLVFPSVFHKNQSKTNGNADYWILDRAHALCARTGRMTSFRAHRLTMS